MCQGSAQRRVGAPGQVRDQDGNLRLSFASGFGHDSLEVGADRLFGDEELFCRLVDGCAGGAETAPLLCEPLCEVQGAPVKGTMAVPDR